MGLIPPEGWDSVLQGRETSESRKRNGQLSTWEFGKAILRRVLFVIDTLLGGVPFSLRMD